MVTQPLHIAWLGPAPGEDGGVPGVCAELLHGLAGLGHRIDCFFPSSGQTVPARLAAQENLTFNWGTSRWQWDRWYSRTRITAFASGMAARGVASLLLRRQIIRRHGADPYDVVYQFSSIESPAVPTSVRRTVPLVIHPETHSAGELRSLIAERRLSLRCQSRVRFASIAAIMLLRAVMQRRRINRARLLICISRVFRDHLVRDYGFPANATVVVANPVRLERFPVSRKALGQPPTVLVLGRIAVRKGVDDVVAVAAALLEGGSQVRVRVVGGPSLWSDYTKLLEDLPPENAEYAGQVPPSEVPAELARADVLLQPSSYEPFALTVAEALAAGVPVVATSEVGAIEQVDRSVAAETHPGDVPAIVAAIVEMLDRVAKDPEEVRAKAHAEAERLFAPELVCGQISTALERLVAGSTDGSAAAGKAGRDPVPA
ncbi:MAG: transferase [Solirubrobacterales bacterium]|nr:transferase [Solirubrobacterales bacterium]